MRLIDGNKLLETYKKWIPQLLSKEDEGDRRGVETFIMVLEDMQTVDAVPVVRCHECKKHSEANGKHYCKFWRMYCPDDSDFFCKAGERKEGAD